MPFFSGSLKKANLLVFITPAQSNEASVDDATAQPTGRTTYATMPPRLQTPLSNVDFVKQSGSSLSIAPMEVLNTNEWGWLNQFFYVISPLWDDIIYCKKSLGGSHIRPNQGGDYPYSDFEARATVAIAEADSRWGIGNYNVLYICGIGETNATTSSLADEWLPAMQDWIDDNLRINFKNAPIIVIKKGRYQNQAFPFIISNLWAAQDAYVALNPSTNKIAEGEGALYELKDQTNDTSHYNNAGSITMGNIVAELGLSIFGISKSDSTLPTLVSAVVENASSSNVILTYDKNLDEYVLPFWKDFTFNSQRKITNVSISGAVVTLTASEPFYTGQTIELTYTKKQYYESVICDSYGNEAAALVAQSVTNNVLTAVPTYVNTYTSNFATLDGWSFLSGGTVASVDGIGGLNDVLECGSTDTTPVVYRNSIFANNTQPHRVRFKIYILSTYNSFNPAFAYTLTIAGATGQAFKTGLYNYIRRNVLSDQWLDLEFTAIPPTSGAMRFDVTNITIGDKFWIRDVVVDRLT